MSTFTGNNVSSGATILASDHNTLVSLIATVVNGGLDDTNITPGSLTEASLSTNIRPTTLLNESTEDFVASGCEWTADSAGVNRNASMSSGVVYINGTRVAVSAVTSRTFTASKDTYIDVGTTGTITYTEVSNNAASPALASNNIRLGIIVTGAGSIATSASINQGQEDRVLPIASSTAYTTADSLGNVICPRDPQKRTLCYRQITADVTTTSTTGALLTGLTLPVIVPTGRKIEIITSGNSIQHSAGGTITASIWDGTVGSGTLIASTPMNVASATGAMPIAVRAEVTPSTASKTYNIGFALNSGTATAKASSTAPMWAAIRLV